MLGAFVATWTQQYKIRQMIGLLVLIKSKDAKSNNVVNVKSFPFSSFSFFAMLASTLVALSDFLSLFLPIGTIVSTPNAAATPLRVIFACLPLTIARLIAKEILEFNEAVSRNRDHLIAMGASGYDMLILEFRLTFPIAKEMFLSVTSLLLVYAWRQFDFALATGTLHDDPFFTEELTSTCGAAKSMFSIFPRKRFSFDFGTAVVTVPDISLPLVIVVAGLIAKVRGLTKGVGSWLSKFGLAPFASNYNLHKRKPPCYAVDWTFVQDDPMVTRRLGKL